MAKMSILFDGFAKLAEDIDAVGGDLHSAVDEALTETQSIVQNNVTTASAIYAAKGRKGYAKGDMYKSIIDDSRIDWNGSIAEVKTGFSANGGATNKGFMHSIFVMYGTPKMNKDVKVYNAIKGTKTRNDIAKKQEEIMLKHLELGKGR